jgi:hypothetical protein
MTPLYSLGDQGQGVKVALAEFEPDLPSDIAAYQACYGTNATVNYTAVDGGAGTGAGSDEAALDIEDVIGLAPQATVDVYQAPTPDVSGIYDVYSTIVADDTDQVVSTSWGGCELDVYASDSSFMTSEQSLFEQAATQGQTVFAAAGDTGSTGCLRDTGTPNQFSLSVDDPASQPYVIGVGGTTLTTNPESVWNDSNDSGGAGGGGVSAVWCMPSYQDQSGIPGIISAYSETNTTDCGSPGYLRETPDVSADADPNSGYVIYVDGSWLYTTAPGYPASGAVIGGTSAAAPLWAAAAALIDSSPFCADYGSGDAGVRPEGLYANASYGSPYYGLALNDITSGNNDYTPSGYSGGLYPATTGYNMAGGLGSPNLAYSGNFYPGLAAQMCFAYRTKLGTTNITGVSPKEGPSSRSTSVTITGSGFLPIAGADELEVGTKWITVACTTTTLCTGALPATTPGTDNLVMSVEDMTLSPVAAPDRFTFVAAPTVTKITPARGPKKGGTKVTIRGSNFVGAVSVRFGAKPATGVHVLSSSEITVTAPPGAGTVYVTASAVGGSSKTTATGRYTFVAPPTVTKITPTSGPKKGGTKVTIRGSNFVGAVSVHFGARLAKLFRVVSSSEIVVIAPRGSGTVYVTVSAVGGSSKKIATRRYRY